MIATGGKLYETLGKQPCVGKYELDLVGNKRKNKFNRTAAIEVRFCKVCINKSEACINKNIPKNIEVYAVEASEVGYEGKDKICWRLLTTHFVESYDQAIDIIELYRKRWHIEQLFRLLKKQGFEMEESELETEWALRKLSILALNAFTHYAINACYRRRKCTAFIGSFHDARTAMS